MRRGAVGCLCPLLKMGGGRLPCTALGPETLASSASRPTRSRCPPAHRPPFLGPGWGGLEAAFCWVQISHLYCPLTFTHSQKRARPSPHLPGSPGLQKPRGCGEGWVGPAVPARRIESTLGELGWEVFTAQGALAVGTGGPSASGLWCVTLPRWHQVRSW